MPEQSTFEQYQATIAAAAREEGQRRSFSFADEWCELAFRQIERWVAEGLEFDPDDLRAALGPAPSPGAAGAVIGRAKKAGLISSRGFTISRSPSRHGGVARRWGPA